MATVFTRTHHCITVYMAYLFFWIEETKDEGSGFLRGKKKKSTELSGLIL